jgi:putative CocE/NonD family hydrolase
VGESRDWLDRYVRGVDNGAERRPRVQLWLADGDREDLLAGRFVRYDARNWPVPRTRWAALHLDPARSGTATSLNDGSLSLGAPGAAARQSYPALPSMPLNTDPYNTAIVGGAGPNQLATAFPVLTETTLAEPLSLTYTSAPLAADALAAGPASLELRLASTAPETAIWAVLSDVAPDGTAHPVATGRLLTAYPRVNRAKSLRRGGEIVQPYNVLREKTPATPGEERLYRVELWPVGNRFAAGHRVRVQVVGASGASAPGVPALNTVSVGAGAGSRLLLPVLPGSQLVLAR